MRSLIEALRQAPYQPHTQKDTDRIMSMMDAAGKGRPLKDVFDQRIVAAAKKMAASITDWKKAARRGAAAENENMHQAASVFFARANELYSAA